MSIAALRWSRGICFLAVLTLAVSSVQADIAEFGASRDTTIFANNPDNSLGGGVAMFAGTNSSNAVRRALISFDLSQIQAGSVINSVQLDLVLADISGGETIATRSVGLHKLVGDWGEGDVLAGMGPGGTGQGDVADLGDATWTYQFFDTDPWITAGGDFVSGASASTLVGSDVNTTYSWNSTATLVADVQAWVDDPDGNFGWLIRGDESEKSTFRNFWTKDAHLQDESLAVYEPKLIVNYTAVPEPSSLALFATGTFVLLAMRRVGRRMGAA